jgi:hypothetical protein
MARRTSDSGLARTFKNLRYAAKKRAVQCSQINLDRNYSFGLNENAGDFMGPVADYRIILGAPTTSWSACLIVLAAMEFVSAQTPPRPFLPTGPLEKYDNPPAYIFRLETSPRMISQYDSFTSYQVNVDANGNNIVGDAANEPSICADPNNTYGPTIPGGWKLVATADFNGDSKSDYVLYKASTRQTAIYYLNNNVYVGSAYGPTLPQVGAWSRSEQSLARIQAAGNHMLVDAAVRSGEHEANPQQRCRAAFG